PTWFLASAAVIMCDGGAFWAKARADRPVIHSIAIRVFIFVMFLSRGVAGALKASRFRKPAPAERQSSWAHLNSFPLTRQFLFWFSSPAAVPNCVIRKANSFG